MAYLVIEWLKDGDKVLEPPQLEALGSNKVIAMNGREEGKPVMMQFKGSLWEGKILSCHGKIFMSFINCIYTNYSFEIRLEMLYSCIWWTRLIFRLQMKFSGTEQA